MGVYVEGVYVFNVARLVFPKEEILANGYVVCDFFYFVKEIAAGRIGKCLVECEEEEVFNSKLLEDFCFFFLCVNEFVCFSKKNVWKGKEC